MTPYERLLAWDAGAPLDPPGPEDVLPYIETLVRTLRALVCAGGVGVGCNHDCASMEYDDRGQEQDCTCGYDAACSEPNAFAEAAIAGRWEP